MKRRNRGRFSIEIDPIDHLTQILKMTTDIHLGSRRIRYISSDVVYTIEMTIPPSDTTTRLPMQEDVELWNLGG
jgi:hypothetical protein